MDKDTAFEMATSNIRYGRGVTVEVGMDLVDMGVGNVMVVTDGVLASLPPVTNLLAALEDSGVRFQLFDRVHVEPTDRSFKEAIDFAAAGEASTVSSQSEEVPPSTRRRRPTSTTPIRPTSSTTSTPRSARGSPPRDP